MSRQTIVVVGNGMVGHKFIDNLLGAEDAANYEIITFAEEPRLAYDRVQMSSYFSGSTAEDLMLTSEDYYRKNGVNYVLNDAVVELQSDAKRVVTASGRIQTYDKLVLATGSFPFVPPIPGKDQPHCLVYRTIEDLEQITASARQSQVGVVVGGGLLGLEAANALRWCVAEMDRRYRLMASLGVRNIGGYNRKVKDAIEAGSPIPDPMFVPPPFEDDEKPIERPTLTPLPFIVVIIDELADMMMIVGKKVEELIARLAQKARASGIHMLLATQRPSVDVITGLIKANIPTRIAFQVSAKVDSRTILDQMGAENLLGHGDMLYLPPGTSLPTRVHGAFVADHEVHAVVRNLRKSGAPRYIEEILQSPTSPTPGLTGLDSMPGDAEDAEQDPLYDQAVQIVVETRKASISGVQRRLKIGYNRAARMVETMEQAGLVGPLQANGAREILVPPVAKD